MTFFSVLTALFIDRVLTQHRPARRHAWFDAYCRRLSANTFAQWLMSHRWGPVAVLLPIVILIGWLQTVFAGLGALAAFAYGSAVLLYSLGPGDLGDDAEGFVEARDQGNEERADALARQLCLGEVAADEPRRSFGIARAVVVLANRRLIAPVFWFVVFGAVGAAAYRAIQLLAERLASDNCPGSMQLPSDELRHVADWLPARLTALGYAIAGNFDAVAHAWRTFDFTAGDGPLAEAEQLLAHTGLAALDTFPSDADELAGGSAAPGITAIPPVIEDALALAWRNLALWVAVIAAGSLVAALA